MLLNVRADFRRESTVLGASVGAIRDIVVGTLVTTLMCLASASVHSGYAFAFEGDPQDVVVSSPMQLPSGQAGTALATKAAHTDALGVPGPKLSVKWEAGKLSLDADGVLLSEVLQAVSHKTGIEVTGAQKLSNRVSAHFAQMDLLQALKELLVRVDYVIAAGPRGSTSAQGARVIILHGAAAAGPPTSLVTADKPNAPAAPETALQQSEANLQEGPEAEPQDSQPAASQTAANEAADEPNAPAAPETALQQPEANLQEEPEAEPQESQLAALQAAATGGDREVLHNYLQDADPTIQAAAFDALAAQDKALAVEDLWANVQDTSQPTRLQALELLVQTAGVNEQTIMAVLRDALQDPDPAFNAYAIQVLAGRGDADATDALREALHSTDPSTRLMVLESIAHTETGLSLLRMALADADKTVSDAAATLLKQAEAGTGAAEKP